MNIAKRHILLFGIGLALIVPAHSQMVNDTAEYPYWVNMMQDPKANFFDTQRAFELYWQNREITKGCGWKPFKRWEYFMESRVDEFGNKPAPDRNWKAYQEYKASKDKSFSEAGGQGNWFELGPISMPTNGGTGQPNGLGRVNCIAFHPSNPSIIYIGAPSGGFWRTTDQGATWATTTDSLPTLGVSSIVVNPLNPSTLYMGSGDRDGSDAPGLGVFKSFDGGDTWELYNNGMGTRVVGRMIMHPTDTNLLLAATSAGIYKTVDGGNNWVKTSSNSNHYKDIAFKPGSPSTVYATENGDFYRSTDTGDNWTRVTSGLASSSTRLAIGVTPADPNTVYCVAADDRVFDGLYRSMNSGTSFVLQVDTPNILDYSVDGSGNGGQGWYDLCIAVDPTDEEVIYVGGVNIFKSTDAGKNWLINAHWTGSGGAPDVHADQHELVYSPQGVLYSGNDGGIYYTSNGGSTWDNISSGLAIAQIYKIGQGSMLSELTINGYQDNGTSVYSGIWSTEIGGDGMECIIDHLDPNYMYGELYYGDIRRSANGGTSFSRIARNGTNGITESGTWVTPYVLDLVNTNIMYIGYRNIWRSKNVKASSTGSVNWTMISNNLAGSNNITIRVLEQSEANSNIFYFSRSDGTLFRSDNIQAAAPGYVDLSSSLPTNTYPVDIEAHPFLQNVVWIVQSNSVYESINKGASWTNITGSLPNVSINCIVFDQSSGDLYVGTDLGVYFRKAGASDWIEYNSGLPITVEVTELEIYYDKERSKSRLKAATYGRGLWESELYESPKADFSTTNKFICINQATSYKDESSGTYNSFTWTFPGGIPGSSNDRNPTVYYPAAGVYPVHLLVSNDLESDLEVKTSFINVSPAQVFVSPDSSYINEGQSVELTATGSANYTWSPPTGLNKTSGSKVLASPDVTTTYYVNGSNGVGCDTAVATVFVRPVGVKEITNDQLITIYPNPANDFISIDFGHAEGNDFEVKLTDLSGKVVAIEKIKLNGETRVATIGIESLNKGVFFVQVRNERVDALFRIVHQ